MKNLMQNVRTDMAEELRRRHAGEIPGVNCEAQTLHGLSVFALEVMNAEGEAALGKPRGHYYTLSLPRFFDRGSEHFSDTVLALSELIRRCLPEKHENVLVAALGNPDITPDALGSLAAGSVLVTRHLKEREPGSFSDFCSLALCRPGVLGTSGLESAEQIRVMCEAIRPQLAVAIDALAGAEADALCRSVQVSDAGISPGSGVGNDRRELSRTTLGVPVVSLGMPTVIDAGFFGEESLSGMFVTPRDIDSQVRAGGKLIGYALNLALHRNLSIAAVDALVGQ